MSTDVTYTEARANFAELWDRVVEDRDTVIIRRRGKDDVALLPADELASLMETAHLLRSPKNAERLLTALARARKREVEPQTVEALKAELGFGEE